MKCIVCKEDLNEGAIFCSKCSHYQKKWRNQLRYVASIAAIITLVFSGLVFILNKVPQLKKQFFPNKSIQVLALNSSYQVNILNSGDGPIFVRDYIIKTPIKPLSKMVNLTIDSGEMKSTAKSNDGIKKYFLNNISPGNWVKYNDDPRGCYGVQYMLEGSTPLNLYRENNGNNLGEYKTTAVINYFYSNSNEWLEHKVEVSGLLYVKSDLCVEEK